MASHRTIRDEYERLRPMTERDYHLLLRFVLSAETLVDLYADEGAESLVPELTGPFTQALRAAKRLIAREAARLDAQDHAHEARQRTKERPCVHISI